MPSWAIVYTSSLVLAIFSAIAADSAERSSTMVYDFGRPRRGVVLHRKTPLFCPSPPHFFHARRQRQRFRAKHDEPFRASKAFCPSAIHIYHHANTPATERIIERPQRLWGLGNPHARHEPTDAGRAGSMFRAMERMLDMGRRIFCHRHHLTGRIAHPQSTWGLVSSARPQPLRYSAGRDGSAVSSKGGIHGGR